MVNHEKHTELIQWHNAIEFFDYNSSVDWAIEFIKKGIETESLLILASFSKPVDRHEIKPYISRAIKELNLNEKYGEYSTIAHAHYHLDEILEGIDMKLNLSKVYELCLSTEHKFGLTTFYLLHHAWSDLAYEGFNYYYEGATLDNIESILKKEASKWIEKNVQKR